MSTATKNRRANMRAALHKNEVYLQGQRVPEAEADSLWLNWYSGDRLSKDPEPHEMKFHAANKPWRFILPVLITPISIIVLFFATSYYAHYKNVEWSPDSVWSKTHGDLPGFLLLLGSTGCLYALVPLTVSAFQSFGVWAGVTLIVAFVALQVFGTYYLWRKVITPLVTI